MGPDGRIIRLEAPEAGCSPWTGRGPTEGSPLRSPADLGRNQEMGVIRGAFAVIQNTVRSPRSGRR